MKARFFRLVRALHRYLGLFMSPFVLVFAISVFFLTHAWLPKIGPQATTTRVIPAFALPANWSTLAARPLIEALKPGLEQAGVFGEVGFIRHQVKGERLVIPVTVPGRETMVTLNLTNREATIVTRETGLAETLVLLHKSPGQHGPAIRMNWFYMKAWRVAADATAWLVLFISLSGVYLWYALRAGRRTGWIMLGMGALTFFGMVYALSH